MFKRILATVLALVMALGVFGLSASAVDEIIYGDMNNDSQINAGDALVVLQMATGIKDATDYEMAIGDVNADATTNSSDALLILQFATGLRGDFTKSYETTLKATKVDPVFANKAFTFKIAMSDDAVGNFDMIFSTDGKSKVIATVILFKGILPVEVRLLNKDKQNYQILDEINVLGKPVDGTGTYCNTKEDVAKMFDDYVRIFTSDVIYGGTKIEKIEGQDHTRETFHSKSGAKFDYYFLGDKLELIKVSNNGNAQVFDITNLEKGADTTRLVIPSSYVYDESLAK